MGEFFRQIFQQAQQIWSALGMAQRVTIAMFVAASILIFSLVTIFSHGTDYVLLEGNLDSQDAAAISQRLSDDNIKYKYEASRGAILVPAGQYEIARQSTLGLGLTGGDNRDGYENFDKLGAGSSKFMQEVANNRAMARSLEIKIKNHFKSVKKASVVIAIPKDELFSDRERDGKATVMLTLGRGGQLSKGNVATISHIVASRHAKLDVRNVAIFDSNGNVYRKFQDDSNPLGGSDEQIAYQMQFEKLQEDKIQTALEQILGVGKSVTRVSAILDFNSRFIRTQEKTGEAIIKRQKTEKDKSEIGNQNSGGPVGAGETNPGEKPANNNRGGSTPEKKNMTKEEIEYMGTPTVKLTDETPQVGKLEKLFVSVIIAKGENDRPEEEIRDLTEIAKRAVGFDDADYGAQNFVLKELKFDDAADKAAGAVGGGMDYFEMANKYGWNVLWGVLFLLLILSFRKIMRTVSAPPPGLEISVVGGGSTQEEEAAAAEIKVKEEIQQAEKAQKQAEVSKVVMDNADQATEMIRSMIS